MIQLSTISGQELAPGQSITFDRVIFHTGCAECHREGTGSVKLRAHGIFEVNFSANITSVGAASQVSLQLEQGGDPLPETIMAAYPVAPGNYYNVATTIGVQNCCDDYDRITVVNTGTSNVYVASGAVLFIRRVS